MWRWIRNCWGLTFENLLAEYNPETGETARKQTGSYYTPRQIVDYMADEALTAALAVKVEPYDDDLAWLKDRLRDLLDYGSGGEKDREHLIEEQEIKPLIEAMSRLKVLDPAVGSGAFPMGILNKLVLALEKLDPENTIWKEMQIVHAQQESGKAYQTIDKGETREARLKEINETFEQFSGDFGRKLYLIQNSIFGVDIQTVACQIAKLRVFISLAVEQVGNQKAKENYGIRPLPNLETRFVAANSLIGLHKGQLSLGRTKRVNEIEREIKKISDLYFNARTRNQKRQYIQKDTELRQALADELRASANLSADEAQQITDWSPYDQNSSAPWFDPEWMFGIREGFDIVIGNPPYSRLENQSPRDIDNLKKYYTWADDLYVHFIFAGLRLVKEKGHLTYITNDSFITLKNKKRVRELFLKNDLSNIIRCPKETFEATIYTAIFMLSKGTNPNRKFRIGTLKRSTYEYLEQGEIDYDVVRQLPNLKFPIASPTLPIFMRHIKMKKVKDFFQVLDTGIHSGNVREKIFSPTKDERRSAPLLQGKQIKKWALCWDSPNAKYKWCNPNYIPEDKLGIGRKGKISKKKEYWNFCGEKSNHHQPQRLLMRQTSDHLVVAMHSEKQHGQFYTDNTLFTILPANTKISIKYALAVLNSNLMNAFYTFYSQEKGKALAQVKVGVIEMLPIAEVGCGRAQTD